ncbi:MAG TPA: glycerol-3-phosphate 1-O-acyltransferase PlsY [Acidisarcina sp.]
MPILTYVLVALVAYLLGSIPFGYLLVRFVRKEDIRSVGSGNIGATNVLRSGAKGLGLLTFVLDAFKGYVAVMAALWILRIGPLTPVPAQDAAAIAAFAAIVGHIFPVWLRFKGGKGVATAFGVLAAIVPWAAFIVLAIFILVVAITRYVSLASVVGAASYPFLAVLLLRRQQGSWPTPLFIVVLVIMSALVIGKHRANLVRLWHGTEYRFGKKPPQSGQTQPGPA